MTWCQKPHVAHIFTSFLFTFTLRPQPVDNTSRQKRATRGEKKGFSEKHRKQTKRRLVMSFLSLNRKHESVWLHRRRLNKGRNSRWHRSFFLKLILLIISKLSPDNKDRTTASIGFPFSVGVATNKKTRASVSHTVQKKSRGKKPQSIYLEITNSPFDRKEMES